MGNSKELGNIAEEKASIFLQDKEYCIIEKNYQKKCGEIDIIAKKGSYIHFIEVKYRKNIKNGYPREAVSFSKQKKIKKTALFYICENNLESVDFSFDIIEIVGDNITYIENAFW